MTVSYTIGMIGGSKCKEYIITSITSITKDKENNIKTVGTRTSSNQQFLTYIVQNKLPIRYRKQ